MTHKKCHGQNLIEYVLIISIVSAAAAAMSTYVFRAIQAKKTDVTKQFQKDEYSENTTRNKEQYPDD